MDEFGDADAGKMDEDDVVDDDEDGVTNDEPCDDALLVWLKYLSLLVLYADCMV